MSLSELNSPPPPPLLSRLTELDRTRMGEALQTLLSHGSVLGLEPGFADLYSWCRQNMDWLREIGALAGVSVFNDHESRLIQAVPMKAAMTLRLKQDATVVLLALWYEYDTQVRDQGATRVVCTIGQLNQLLREKLLPDLKEPPSRGRLVEILRMADRFNLVRVEFRDRLEDSRIEVLPTLKRVVPFKELEEWSRAAAMHRGIETGTSGGANASGKALDEEEPA